LRHGPTLTRFPRPCSELLPRPDLGAEPAKATVQGARAKGGGGRSLRPDQSADVGHWQRA